MDAKIDEALQAAHQLHAAGVPDPLTPNFAFRGIGGRSSLFEQIFALRYKVYCLECAFLDPNDYPHGLETDEYDLGAAHFTAHTQDGELAGASRLVHPFGLQRFPFEQHCRELFPGIVLPHRDESAEISRLVVAKHFRRRPGDNLAGVPQEFTTGQISKTPGAPTERRNSSPQILLGIYRQMYQYSLQHGVRYWYAAMERSLLRALSRYGFEFTPLGPPTDYYGPVTPYIADLRALERGLVQRDPALLTWFRGGHALH